MVRRWMVQVIGVLCLLGASSVPGHAQTAVAPIYEYNTRRLLGATSGGRWLTDDVAAARLRGGEAVRVYSSNALLGRAAMSKPTQDEVPCDYSYKATISPQLRGALLAVGGAWNPLPRRPVAFRTDLPVYRTAVATLLRSRGIANPDVRITKIWRIDLEGDGVPEVLFSATRFTADPTDANAGDYSFVAMRKTVRGQVQTTVLGGKFYPTFADFAAPNTYTLLGVFDLNGDGIQEVLVGSGYYEGAATEVFQISGVRATSVLQTGCGV